MAAHRYWRIWITTAPEYVSCAELELRTSVGGSDVTGSGTASASTSYDTPYVASKAFDNDAGTLWCSSSRFSSGYWNPSWLAYDFGVGNAYDIIEISFKTRSDSTAANPRDFDIQYSDNGTDWTTYWSVTNEAGWSAGEARVYTKPAAATTTAEVSTDTTTLGSWKGVYGADGYQILGDSTSLPAYVTAGPTPTNKSDWSWGTSVDTSYLEKASVAGRQLSAWYNTTQAILVDFTLSEPAQLAVYCCEPGIPNQNERQWVIVRDATTKYALATADLNVDLSEGIWAVFNLSAGSFQLHILPTAVQAVVDAFLFAPSTANEPPTASTITAPTDGSTVGGSFTLSVTPGTDPDVGDTLTTYYRTTLDGGTPSAWTVISGSATVTSAAGSLLIEAKTNDGTVDGPTASITVTVDLTAPATPSVTDVDVNYTFATITASAFSSAGRTHAGSQFRVYAEDGVTVAWDSGWIAAVTSYDDAPLAALTTYAGATVQYKDELGNVSAESALFGPFTTGDTPALDVTYAALAVQVAESTPEARATQVVLEPVVQKPGYAQARATQVVLEAIIPNKYATGARIVRKVVGRILVTNAFGVWVDLCDLDGRNFVQAAEWEFSIDTPVGQAVVTAFRELSDLKSLAPLLERSLYNREDFEGDSTATLGDYAPLLQPGRGLRIQFAIVDADVTATDGDFQTFFDGHIDTIDWAPGETATAGKDVHIEGRDLGAELLDHFIEAAVTYTKSGGYPLEELIQDILDDNAEYRVVTVDPASDIFTGTFQAALEDGDRLFFSANTLPGGLAADTEYFVVSAAAPTFKVSATRGGAAIDITSAGSSDLTAARRVMLYSENGTDTTPFNPADSPGWAISPSYTQEQESLLEALRTLALQIGYDLRYVRQTGTLPWRLTLINPDRDQATPDYSLTGAQYIRVGKAAVSRADVRNVIRIIYNVDDSTDPPTGDVVQLEDTASQTKYGRRFASIGEPSTSAIDTVAEATAMATAALKDLQEPIADQEVELHFRPEVELRDLIRFLPNGLHFDTAQQLAVVSHHHQVAHSGDTTQLRTTIQARGYPVGAYRDWLKRDTRTITGKSGPTPAPSNISVYAVVESSSSSGAGDIVFRINWSNSIAGGDHFRLSRTTTYGGYHLVVDPISLSDTVYHETVTGVHTGGNVYTTIMWTLELIDASDQVIGTGTYGMILGLSGTF